ncbi:MAG: electron transport complex subunit E [bacterium]|nr:electron transport complex subunit E [bacterium]
MNKCTERVYNGIVKENPTFVLMLGMCPTLAVTTSAMNGLGMGLTTTAVLIFSNLIISALRNIIPDRVRIPAFIVIVASLVTIVQLLLQAYLSTLYDALGIYIPLIVVNCIILGRAESYASKNDPLSSAFDGVGMGLGFTVGLTAIGIFREILGAGQIFGFTVMPASYEPISIFILAPGAFFVLAMLTALQNKFKMPSATNLKGTSELACGGDCMHCSWSSCSSNHDLLEEKAAAEAEEAARKKAEAAKKAAEAKKAAAAKQSAEATNTTATTAKAAAPKKE